MTDDCWGLVRSELESSLGNDAYQNWIAPLEFQGISGGVASFAAPTNFIGNWVNRNYGAQIRDLMAERGTVIERLEFRAQSVPSAAAQAPQATGAVAQKPVLSSARVGTMEIPNSPLNPRFTFDQFIVGKPNELAHAAARRVACAAGIRLTASWAYGVST